MSEIPPQEPQVNQGVAITPGMHFAPGPVTIDVTAQMMPDGQKIILLHVEHLTGSTWCALNPEFCRTLADKLIEQASGIQIARADSRITHG